MSADGNIMVAFMGFMGACGLHTYRMQHLTTRKTLSLPPAVHGRIMERAARMSTAFGRPVAVGEVIQHLLNVADAQEKSLVA